MVVVMKGRGRAGVRVVGVEGGGHEGKDLVQADGSYEGEAVDVAEVDFSAEEKEGAEEEEEEDGAGEVGVVHDVLVDSREGVQDRERLDRR